MKMRLILFLLVWLSGYWAVAQSVDFKPDITRALFHSRLDEAQLALLHADGKRDMQLAPYEVEELNVQLTYYATQHIDDWQKRIEQSTDISHQEKIKLLRGMTEVLNAFTAESRSFNKSTTDNRKLGWHHLPAYLQAFEDGLVLHAKNEAITAAIVNLPYSGAVAVSNSIVFIDNPHAAATRQYLFLKYLGNHPESIFSELTKASNLGFPFTDSLILEAARRNPDQLVTYAQAKGTPLSRRIFAHPHPFVQLVSGLAANNRGQMYMPFLDRITAGTITLDEVSKALADTTAYFKLLVQSQIEYARRQQKGEHLFAAKGMADMVKRKGLETYVNTINGLHDYAAPIRFKSIQNLGPADLYYLIVMNEAEIYTSSYLYVFNRIFELMPGQGTDSLLSIVAYDRYKKFLTMASNYNTLDNVLARMSKARATELMLNFVNNLDKASGEDDIEDAVDVANAYATLSDSTLRQLMRDQVNRNLEEAIANNNRKGEIIYRLEKLIMASNDPASKINLSDSLGILPVYQVSNQYLRDSSGRIVMQMYFYGDGSGKGSFNTLLNLMGDRTQWKMTSTPQWVQWTSLNAAVPFVLFANRALDEEQDLDDKAQHALIEWMTNNGYEPSITVHRGHSYYLGQTIEKMLPSSKVVVLGSCGAYHNLADVLKISPEAYIIASKQVGYGVINVQLFMYLINELKKGKDVVWPAMMDDVAGRVGAGRKNDFDDYIFPHKNLGAIFIKAYKKAMEDTN